MENETNIPAAIISDVEDVVTQPHYIVREIERLHSRMDEFDTQLSRLRMRQQHPVDPMDNIMMWLAVAYVVSAIAPLIIEMWRRPVCAE